jgi:hypothetical protein
LYVDHSSSPERIQDYLEQYILSSRDYQEYLEKIGGTERLMKLKARKDRGY